MSTFDIDILRVKEGTMADYNMLKEYHYRTGPVRPAVKIFLVHATGKHFDYFPDPLAIVVYRMPLPCLKARTRATSGFFSTPKTQSDRLKLVNKYIRYLARIIVHPNFRKLGIATFLLNKTLHQLNVPLIETLTPVDFTNKMFKNVGFNSTYSPPAPWYTQMKNAFLQLGLSEQSLELPALVHNRINALTYGDFIAFDREMKNFTHHFRHRMNMPHTLKRTKFILDKVYCPGVYLLWENPKMPLPHQK